MPSAIACYGLVLAHSLRLFSPSVKGVMFRYEYFYQVGPLRGLGTRSLEVNRSGGRGRAAFVVMYSDMNKAPLGGGLKFAEVYCR